LTCLRSPIITENTSDEKTSFLKTKKRLKNFVKCQKNQIQKTNVNIRLSLHDIF
jgi:hypothetical protein